MLAVGGERRKHEAHRLADEAVEPEDAALAAVLGEEPRDLGHHRPAGGEPARDRAQRGRGGLPAVGGARAGVGETGQGDAHADSRSGAPRPSRSSSARTSFLVTLP